MSEIATFRTRTTEGFPRWSMTRYAAARPNTWLALHSAPRAPPKRIVNATQSKPIDQTSAHCNVISKPRRFRTPSSAQSNLHSARQPSHSTSRAFLHWRLSDDGPGASRIVPVGRHPKPFTKAAMRKTVIFERGRVPDLRGRATSAICGYAATLLAGLLFSIGKLAERKGTLRLWRRKPPVPRTIVEPNRMPPVNLNNSERDEIRQRVANFKAHQQRFIRERKDYAASEWKRMLASQS